MYINTEIIKELLAEAFDAGWYGTKELKDSVIRDLIKKAFKAEKKVKSIPYDPLDHSMRSSRSINNVYSTISAMELDGTIQHMPVDMPPTSNSNDNIYVNDIMQSQPMYHIAGGSVGGSVGGSTAGSINPVMVSGSSIQNPAHAPSEPIEPL